jgi:lysophospholipase L1-like esterase
MSQTSLHVVLLGDSIFDNGVYVPGQPDVVRQLRQVLGPTHQATLLAVDGAVTDGVARQVARVPADASWVVVSAGGNDALGEAHLLGQPCGTVGEAVSRLEAAQRRFAARYEAMVDGVTSLGVPTALCTIYDANFPGPDGRIIRAALSLFNDAITRAAFVRKLPLIDLRLICNDAGDYANPIEPSAQGGEKIAKAIGALVCGDTAGRSLVMA